MSLLLTIEDDIATILISRAQQKNAISLSMWRRLADHIDEIKRADVRVTVVRGAGHSFSAGADLFEISKLETLDEAMAYWLAIKGAVEGIASLKSATIALIEGFCIGGGCLIALACDLRFASSTAQFGLPEAKFGLMCDRATLARLVNLVGPAGASEMLLVGDVKTAQQALRLGLVNEIFTEDRLADHVKAVARTIAKNDKEAILQVKQLMVGLNRELSLERGLPKEAAFCFSTEEEDRSIAESFLAPNVKARIKRLIATRELL